MSMNNRKKKSDHLKRIKAIKEMAAKTSTGFIQLSRAARTLSHQVQLLTLEYRFLLKPPNGLELERVARKMVYAYTLGFWEGQEKNATMVEKNRARNVERAEKAMNDHGAFMEFLVLASESI